MRHFVRIRVFPALFFGLLQILAYHGRVKWILSGFTVLRIWLCGVSWQCKLHIAVACFLLVAFVHSKQWLLPRTMNSFLLLLTVPMHYNPHAKPGNFMLFVGRNTFSNHFTDYATVAKELSVFWWKLI